MKIFSSMVVSFVAGSVLFASDFSQYSNDELVNLAGSVEDISGYISEVENRVSKMSEKEVIEFRNKLNVKEKQIVIAMNDDEKANYKKDIQEALQTKATSSRSVIKEGADSLETKGEEIIKKGADKLEKGKKSLSKGASKAKSATEKGVEKGTKAIKDGAKKGKNAIESGVKKGKNTIEKGIEKGADETVKAIQKGVEKLESSN